MRTINVWRRVETITRQLELCGASADELALVLRGPSASHQLASVVATALARLGLTTSSVELTQVTEPAACPPVLAMIDIADLIIDVGTGLGDDLHRLAPDARILCLDLTDADALDDLVAHPGLARRADRYTELLWASDAFRVDAASGEVLHVPLEACRVRSDVGVASRPGDVARWPAASVWCAPDPALVSGTIIAMPGDIVADAAHIFRSPVRLEIDRGHLVEILGESDDADLVRVQLEHADDDDAYVLAEIGVGLGLTRGAAAGTPFDPDRVGPGRVAAAAGNCTVVFGTALSLTLTSASLTVRDSPVVADGALVGPFLPDIYELAAAT